MTRTSLLVLTVLSVGVADWARGEDLAASRQLPPALTAIGGQRADVLTASQAHRVRGENILLPSNQGVFVQFAGTSNQRGGKLDVNAIVGGEAVTLIAVPGGVSFASSGIAVQSEPGPNFGILQTATGVFDGAVSFEGKFSRLGVVALPGAFAFDIR